MLRVRPFRAVRPQPNHAAQVASVPYDVVNTVEARELADGLPHSFLRIVRSEIELPPSTDPHDGVVYSRARENLQRFISDGVLMRESEPRMFLYRQVMNHVSQIGLVCCCHIDDYLNDLIKKHEKTRKDKEDDRTRHVLELNAHAEPVFLTYRDVPEIDELVHNDTNSRPLFHFVAKDGVTHTVWAVRNPQIYINAFEKVPGVSEAYIADGHHRTASAVRAGTDRRKRQTPHGDGLESDWFLSVLFPASQLHIMAYNRVVKDLNGHSQREFLLALADVGKVSATMDPKPPRAGTVCVYGDGSWNLLEFDPTSIDRADPIGSLDVSLLQERVLTSILGIGDVRTDKRIDFVGGIRGTAELERRVNSGEMAVAFNMYPTTIEQLMAVSDAGHIMPPKSTWFEPKLRSGLFVHMLD